ncbi:MAG TPA: twin-arginine translocase TatA/TatE family subunit [Solirubrobacteraceae bacterium]|jgi:sec-independent protein translocase protein TatA
MGLDNPLHIAFLLVLVLLVFGAKRLPEMGRSLGHGMRGFKDAIGGESPPPATVTPSAVRGEQPHIAGAGGEQPDVAAVRGEQPHVAAVGDERSQAETADHQVAA